MRSVSFRSRCDLLSGSDGGLICLSVVPFEPRGDPDCLDMIDLRQSMNGWSVEISSSDIDRSIEARPQLRPFQVKFENISRLIISAGVADAGRESEIAMPVRRPAREICV